MSVVAGVYEETEGIVALLFPVEPLNSMINPTPIPIAISNEQRRSSERLTGESLSRQALAIG
jgi:hypothetical protein